MLNVMNIKNVEIYINREKCSLFPGKVHSHIRRLDMRRGSVIQKLEWETITGKRVEIVWGDGLNGYVTSFSYG
ncbi:hypothetical protein BSK48_19995 [Paenibacillus odorifer]|nr:hypothetical protein BSK48_19995 [Paenibacillus odorifer]OMD78644.1 hypothetical protein BSK53_23515 [Paenibacillus odorifer]